MLEGHGDDGYNYRGKVKMNFSSNIFSHIDLSGLKRHLSEHLDLIDHYPEPEPHALEWMIAERAGIEAGNVLVTNGATEAIYLIARLFGRDRQCVCTPTFAEYEAAISVAAELPASERMIHWICNPNNPTGAVLPLEEWRRRLGANASDIYVVDQSYAAYTLQPTLPPSVVNRCRRCLLVYSMTKRYGIPGLRLGYVVAAKRTIGRLRKYKPTWSVNALAIEAGKYLLKHDIPNFPDMHRYLAETQRLRAGLNRIEGVAALQTETNFMLVRLPRGTAAALKTYLIDRHGILVRDASNFKGLNERYIRVAAQLPEENDALVEAVKTYMSCR